MQSFDKNMVTIIDEMLYLVKTEQQRKLDGFLPYFLNHFFLLASISICRASAVPFPLVLLYLMCDILNFLYVLAIILPTS